MENGVFWSFFGANGVFWWEIIKTACFELKNTFWLKLELKKNEEKKVFLSVFFVENGVFWCFFGGNGDFGVFWVQMVQKLLFFFPIWPVCLRPETHLLKKGAQAIGTWYRHKL